MARQMIMDESMELAVETRLRANSESSAAYPKIKVLILGVDGFIGSHLTERLLKCGQYEVYGLDTKMDALRSFLDSPHFTFMQGGIETHTEWIDYHLRQCDVVLPLAAIATPVEYVRNPLKVFELDFEENLKIVRSCVKYNKRIVFPSTSEVYGTCDEVQFDEDKSRLILGPIHKQRWIYSSIKQLLDRVIWAYGQEKRLNFTIFRPFNWIGPRLDSLKSAETKNARVITQLIWNLTEGSHINLVDGGKQKRCFTDIDDGIEALFKIIENQERYCNGKIINIGNPSNAVSIRKLAIMLLYSFDNHPSRKKFPPFSGFKNVSGHSYYGRGYQDMSHRQPSIANAKRYLGWEPKIPLKITIDKTLNFFLHSLGAVDVS